MLEGWVSTEFIHICCANRVARYTLYDRRVGWCAVLNPMSRKHVCYDNNAICGAIFFANPSNNWWLVRRWSLSFFINIITIYNYCAAHLWLKNKWRRERARTNSVYYAHQLHRFIFVYRFECASYDPFKRELSNVCGSYNEMSCIVNVVCLTHCIRKYIMVVFLNDTAGVAVHRKLNDIQSHSFSKWNKYVFD